MSFKKTDLYKNLRMKIQGRMGQAGVPDRFAGQGEALVPFATKLPKALVKQLQTQALIQGVPTGELVAVLLRAALGDAPVPEPVLAPVVKAAAVKKPAEKPAPAKKVPAKKVPAKKVPAKKAAAKKAVEKAAVVKPAVAKKAPQAHTAAKSVKPAKKKSPVSK